MHLEAWKDVWHDTKLPFCVGALSPGHSGLTALSAFLFTAAVKHKRVPLLFSATVTGLNLTCDIAETSHSSTQKWLFCCFYPFVFSDPNRPVFTAVVRDGSWGWTSWFGNRLLSYQWADELKTNCGCGNTLTGAAEEWLMFLEQFDVLVEFRLTQTCRGPNQVSNKAMWYSLLLHD